ncbi:MAG: hypothetical protein CO128_09720 [Ignavibacteriales bacterium CG_4_9_14_3_um_filter_30_11]|nr:MAG: hypothetical protein CO128_09720 [Ignavibacteriales bacterium CG_4_9_14_3_um_filter_30_11]
MVDKRIFKYLDNVLDKNEKLKFEDDLIKLPELKKEFEKYKLLNSKFNNEKEIEFDKTYFNGIVSEFRNRLETKKKSKKIFAFSFANSLAAIIIFYLILSPSNSLNLNEIVKNWNENDFNNAIEYAEPKLSEFSIADYSTLDSLVTNMLSDELNLLSSKEALNVIDNSLDYKNITIQISNVEAEEIYNKILNKKYF